MPEEQAADAANADVSQIPASAPEDAVTEEGSGETEGKTAEEQATSEDGQDEQKPKKFKGGFQKSIDRLTREKYEEQREKEYWREQALRNQRPESQQPTQQEPSERPKPDVNAYSSYEEGIEALADWRAEQRFKELLAKESAQREQEAVKQRLESKEKEARAKYADFADALAAIPQSAVIGHALRMAEEPAEVAYFLGTHTEEANRLVAMPFNSPAHAMAIAREVGKLEARLAGAATPADKTPPPQTKAPAPPSPVGKATGTDIAPRDSDSTEEWMQKERARLAALRK